MDDGVGGGGLSRAGSAGDDEDAVVGGGSDGFSLFVGIGQAGFFLEGAEVGFGVEQGLCRVFDGDDPVCDAFFGVVVFVESDGVVVVEDDVDVEEERVAESFAEVSCGDVEVIGSRGEILKDMDGQARIAFCGLVFEDGEDAGADTEGAGVGDADEFSHGVGFLEAHAAEVVGESVRVFFEDVDGVAFVFLEDLDGKAVGDVVAFEPDHDFAQLVVFPYGVDEALDSLLADAVYFLEAFRFVVEHIECVVSEGVDDGFGVDGTDILDESGREVFYDAFPVGRTGFVPGGDLEGWAVFGLLEFSFGFDARPGFDFSEGTCDVDCLLDGVLSALFYLNASSDPAVFGVIVSDG